MITGKTSSGFEYELDEGTLDDYELLNAIQKFDQGDPLAVVDMIDRLLGEEQRDALKEHVREENGRVPMTKMLKEAMEIFENQNKTKN